MIHINSHIAIDENELKEEFVRASGPGGQNVNKVATAVQLRFDARNSPSLPEDVRARLLRLAGRRANSEGVIIIDARQYRMQEQNRAEARARLIGLIREAAKRPRARRKTKPTAAARRHRLDTKRRRGEVKKLRHGVHGE